VALVAYPALMLVAGWLMREKVTLLWLVASGLYVVEMSWLAILNSPSQAEPSRLERGLRMASRATAPLVWGG